jgi:hypothetical protein
MNGLSYLDVRFLGAEDQRLRKVGIEQQLCDRST